MNKKILAHVYGIAGIVAVIGFLSWADKHDEQVQEAATTYEACIQSEYNVMPYEYYNEHGVYPKCTGAVSAQELLRQYYQAHPEDQPNIERLINENPELTDEEILQIVNG